MYMFFAGNVAVCAWKCSWFFESISILLFYKYIPIIIMEKMVYIIIHLWIQIEQFKKQKYFFHAKVNKFFVTFIFIAIAENVLVNYKEGFWMDMIVKRQGTKCTLHLHIIQLLTFYLCNELFFTIDNTITS